MEKVPYDTDLLSRVKDIFQNRKKREIDIDADDGEKVSFFNYIKDSTAGKCKASVSKQQNEIKKKRKKRNVFSSSPKHYNSDYLREKRRAEQELLELQHKYVRCNKYAGEGATQCREIYERFKKLVREINEKFHQFDVDNFEDVPNMVDVTEKIQKNEQNVADQTNEVIPPNKGNQIPDLQKNNENVGQTFFGDGFYSYTYDKIPKFHEELNGPFNDQQRNLKTTARDSLTFQNQIAEQLSNKGDQTKNIPVKVPDPTGD